MGALNTNYGLRMPSDKEIRTAFGSLADCVRVTGGDLPTILFYLANPQEIRGAGSVGEQPGSFARDLCEKARTEQAAAVFDAMEKPTIAAVSREIGVCRPVARRALVAAGKVPA